MNYLRANILQRINENSNRKKYCTRNIDEIVNERNSKSKIRKKWIKSIWRYLCKKTIYAFVMRRAEANCLYYCTLANCIKRMRFSRSIFHLSIPNGRCKFQLIVGPVYWRFSRGEKKLDEQNKWCKMHMHFLMFSNLHHWPYHSFSLLPISQNISVTHIFIFTLHSTQCVLVVYNNNRSIFQCNTN